MGRRKRYFLGKYSTGGSFLLTLDSSTSTAGARSLASAKEHFYQKNSWRLQPTGSNVGTTASDKAVASPPKLKMKMKPDAQTNTLLPTNVQQMHFTCRDIIFA